MYVLLIYNLEHGLDDATVIGGFDNPDHADKFGRNIERLLSLLWDDEVKTYVLPLRDVKEYEQ